MNWSPQQAAGLDAIKTWLEHPSPQVFRLFGYAGTGKTTIIREVANMVKGRVCYAAFTGKAASVMRKKGCQGASTIHSLIYELKRNDGDILEFRLKLKRDSDLRDASLVIIDECSMVDEELGEDLLSFGTKILVLGDPAQLPPVRGTGFFTSATPNIMLTEVHRQAAENPIIQLSMQIRNGERLALGEYGDTRIISRMDISADQVLSADQIIVGLNRTRLLYNNRMRELLQFPDRVPQKEDKIICLRNDRNAGVFNGSMWTIKDVVAPRGRNYYELDILPAEEEQAAKSKPKRVEVLKAFFEGTEDQLDWLDRRGMQEFTFGYAITCHKSQGSQWNDIVVFDESGSFRQHGQAWLYTAVTRAAEKLTLVV